ATPAFGRRCSDPLSYETKLGLQLRVPVDVIRPALVQIVGRKRALGRQQLVERRLLWRTPRLDACRVGLAGVARHAGRDDVRPGRLSAARPWNDVLERQCR